MKYTSCESKISLLQSKHEPYVIAYICWLVLSSVVLDKDLSIWHQDIICTKADLYILLNFSCVNDGKSCVKWVNSMAVYALSPGPLFTKRMNVLPQDLMKSQKLRNLGLDFYNHSEICQAPRQ